VVDPASDDFYRSHKFANYGEVGLSVKELVDKFSSQSAAHKQVRGMAPTLSRTACRKQDIMVIKFVCRGELSLSPN
jgi:hypothetical protein